MMRINPHKNLSPTAKALALAVCCILILGFGCVLYMDDSDLNNRKYATNPYALLCKAKLQDIQYGIECVRIDTVDHYPVGIHVQYTYRIRMLDSLAFNRRVEKKWKVHIVDGIPERCWFSNDYMQFLRIIDKGLVEARACYDVDYHSYPY